MALFIAIVLVLVALVFFILVQRGYITDRTVSNLANVASVVSLLAAIIIFITSSGESIFWFEPDDEVREAQQVDSKQTQGRQTFTVGLDKNETIVGHADRFYGEVGCVAFIMTGPGSYVFGMENGIYYKWINTRPEIDEMLLQDNVDILVNTYNCDRDRVKIVRLPTQ